MNALENEARKLAASPDMQAVGAGFDPAKWLDYVNNLLSMLSICAPLFLAHRNQSTKEMLTEHYDGERFDRKLMVNGVLHSRHAAHKAGLSMDRHQHRDSVEATFRHAMNTDDATVGAVLACCPQEDVE